MAVAIDRWHRLLETRDISELETMLHDDVVFYSPVVHTPQRGKAVTSLYLGAADQVLNGGGHFRYLREVIGDGQAVLEFVTEIDGVEVNGVDIISWDENDLITEFKVMVRPLQAVKAIHAAMGRMLEAFKQGGG